jgi:transcriptional regulator with XRE-family HTH domain
MDKRTKEKRNGDRLRPLRKVIGASQERFAEIIGISHDTIRSIEAGRRALTDEILEKIAVAVGAKWNDQLAAWDFAYAPNNMSDSIPFTREIFTEYRRVIETPPGNTDSWQEHVAWEIKRLFEHVPAKNWYPLLFRIEACIRDWQSEFKIEGKLRLAKDFEIDLGECLEKSRPAFLMVFNPQTGKIDQFMPVPAEAPEIHKPDFPAASVFPVKTSKKKTLDR